MKIESIDQKIAKDQEKMNQLKENIIQLKAQKQAALAREKSKQKAQERKDETRRKILLGSFLLKEMEDEAQKQKILAGLNQYLTEERDRKLFDL
jgi:predicted amidophosphoribosyltransferase